MTRLGNLRIKSLGTAISGLLMVVAVLVVASSYFTVRQVDQIGRTWERFDKGAAAKADILGNLLGALGYGGVIHHFKDYVLRRDRLRIIKIQEKLFDISFALTAYRRLGINEQEKSALAQIQETLSKYAAAVVVAELMAASGASAQEIDMVVTIDDRSALDAFAVLHAAHLQGRQTSAQSVYRSVDLVKNLAPSVILVISGLLVILVVSFLWFTRSRLVKPLAHLECAMQKLASGDTKIDVPAITRDDELGTMAKTVLVFKENAIQRHQAEEALQKSEARLSGILEIVSAAVVSVDEACRVRLFNKGAQTTFGYAPEEVLGQPLEMLMPQSIHDHHRKLVKEFAISPKISRTMAERNEIAGLRKDGTEFPMEAGISRLDLNGDTIFTAVLNDITDRKKSEADLLEAKELAEAANRSKSNFLASMSHEIRTPMNGVLGMVGVLLDSDLSPEQRKQAQTIKDSGELLLLLLNDILDLSKIEAGQVELELLDFDLQGLLDSVVALWESRLQGKGLTFSIEIAADVAPVLKTDPTRIRQILFNLIGNAAKFTKQGGVDLDISQRHLTDDELELRFAVTDTGIGVSPEAQSRLFTKFSQADGSVTRKYGGTGLGLVICKQLTELLGGEINFESAPGEGSTFWFTVRCAPGDADAIESEIWMPEDTAIDASETDRPLRILVAEDNHVNQIVLQAMLSKFGHKIDMVGNGAEAVSAVMRAPYDLILMDVHMPEMDGITATQRIRDLSGETGNLPIIALTANAMKGDRETYLKAGMTDYVSKPINPQILFAAIAKCGGRKLTDEPQEMEFMKQGAQDGAEPDDAASALQELMGGLDDLIKEA